MEGGKQNSEGILKPRFQSECSEQCVHETAHIMPCITLAGNLLNVRPGACLDRSPAIRGSLDPFPSARAEETQAE